MLVEKLTYQVDTDMSDFGMLNFGNQVQILCHETIRSLRGSLLLG